MDAAAHYRHLLHLGRDEFLAAAAPAVFVRHRLADPPRDPEPTQTGASHLTIDHPGPAATDETLPHGKLTPEAVELEVYPLAKKPGASFPERITIGRTANNDVAISDHSVSRLHAYIRQAGGWLVADAGSKNGSWLDDVALEPRRETGLQPRSVLRLGDVVLTFYLSAELFDLLGDDHGRR
jgi:hypothetical protein